MVTNSSSLHSIHTDKSYFKYRILYSALDSQQDKHGDRSHLSFLEC